MSFLTPRKYLRRKRPPYCEISSHFYYWSLGSEHPKPRAAWRLHLPKGDHYQQTCRTALGQVGSGPDLQVAELLLTYSTGLKIKICLETSCLLIARSIQQYSQVNECVIREQCFLPPSPFLPSPHAPQPLFCFVSLLLCVCFPVRTMEITIKILII